NLVIHLNQPGAEAVVVGAFHGTRADRHQVRVVLHHNVRNTKSDILLRGVYEGNSSGTMAGLIVIEPDAHRTVAHYSGHALLFDHASALSVPTLEIQTDDVRASHSATIRTVSGEELFYLSSRGITPGTARRMIAGSFLTAHIGSRS
ncbi:MAG: SufD family Fe-S cluster assembly protein, partial [Patescibacteria group bacterium]|nr:SufD family Fe-S cluster assembly protein [Patescibacteria group bacterium]